MVGLFAQWDLKKFKLCINWGDLRPFLLAIV